MKTFQKDKAKIKQADGTYKLTSFWTHADTVEFDDSTTLSQYSSDVASRLAMKGDHLAYDDETHMLYLLSGTTRLSGVEITTGEGEILGDVTNVSANPTSDTVTIKWTDPSDGTTIEWGGTLVLRKKWSRPVDALDGTVVVNSTTRNAYQSNGYVDSNLDKNTAYWYRFFPYTTDGKIRSGLSIAVNTLADETVIEEYPSITGTYTYDGSEQSPQFVNYDSEKMTASGASQTNAGTYVVTITPKEGYTWPDNSSDPISLQWVIHKAKIERVPSQNGTITYSGSERTPLWYDYDENKLVISGDTTGINAGTYTVIFIPTSNYTWSDDSTTGRSVTWSIECAQISAIPSPIGTIQYDGTQKTPEWNNYDINRLDISGQTYGVNIGSYVVVFTPKTNYKWNDDTVAEKEVTWEIVAQVITTVPTQSNTLTYNGNTQTPTWNNYDNAKLTIGGATSAKNAGSYTATFTPKSGYTWADGTTTAKNCTWSIGRQVIGSVPTVGETMTYSGDPQSPTWNYYDSNIMTIGGTTSATNAGTYTTTFTPTSNYQWAGGSTGAKNVSWTINKAPGYATVSADSVDVTGSTTVTVNSATGALSVSSQNTSVATASLSGSTITITGVATGSTVITINIAASTNYLAGTKSINVNVTKNQTINVPSQSGTLTYNGATKTPTWSGYDNNKMVIGGTTSATNAGTYTATFTPRTGYQWSDSTTTAKSVSWVIGKAASRFTVNRTSLTLRNGETDRTSIVASNFNIRESTGYPDVTVSQTTVGLVMPFWENITPNPSSATLSVMGTKVGTGSIILEAAGDDNYEAGTKTINVTVTE